MKRMAKGLLYASLLAKLIGCSGSDSNGGSGGATSIAGSGNGGMTGAGGATSGNGGSKATDGGSAVAGVGGTATGNGGAPTTGGTVAGTGGNATGGSNATGGTSNASGTGGAKATTGGTTATGTTSAAGSKATGGASSAGGSKSVGGATSTGGTKAAGGASSTGGTENGGATTGTRASVLQHHNHPSRDGIYVDSAITKASAATLHIDTSFAGATVSGPTYAQPLYLASNGSGPDLVIAATEQNRVYAFNAASGALVYNVLLASPLQSSALPCGNITPQLGVTGTPIIDAATRTLYVDAMTGMTAASSARHQVYALNADTGAVLSGWPVDLNAKVTSGSTTFNSLVQNQRGALALLGGKVFVPFGGHLGDCQTYHGWIVGISTADPTQVSAWATRAIAGGVWAPGGIASDGTSLFFATGNTEANPNSFAPPNSWQDGETIFRLPQSLAAVIATTDYFVPTNWSAMDQADQDLGGTNPIVFDVAGANPSGLVIGLGKDGKAYLLNRANLGGIAAPLAGATVGGSIINSAAEYTTSTGTYVVFKGGSNCPSGQSGGLMAIKIGATSPPTVTVAWCGGPTTQDSPAVSMSNAQGQDALIWIVGTDNKLHGLDGSTGASVYAGGSGTDTMSAVQKFQTPIVANGRVFVAANNQLYAFTP